MDKPTVECTCAGNAVGECHVTPRNTTDAEMIAVVAETSRPYCPQPPQIVDPATRRWRFRP